MKTLKREEIYANEYQDLADLRTNIEAFIDQYYNRQRLHSALGYRPPEEFEQAIERDAISTGATMSFFRHKEIFRSDVNSLPSGETAETSSPAHRLDESPAGYSLAGWFFHQSPPPLHQPSVILKEKRKFEKEKLLNCMCANFKLSQRRGPPHATVPSFVPPPNPTKLLPIVRALPKTLAGQGIRST